MRNTGYDFVTAKSVRYLHWAAYAISFVRRNECIEWMFKPNVSRALHMCETRTCSLVNGLLQRSSISKRSKDGIELVEDAASFTG